MILQVENQGNQAIHGYDLGVAPSQDASDRQDYYIFRIGDPNLNLHLQLASWEGATPEGYDKGIHSFISYFHTSCPARTRSNPKSPRWNDENLDSIH